MLIRWQPIQEIDTFRRQLDRLIDNPGELAHEANRGAWAPATELQDSGDTLTLRVAIPGIDRQDLDIQVTKDIVTVSGERRQESPETKKGYYWSEVRYGKFHRAMKLPVPVQNERVTADYTNGMLTLTLPKANEVKAFKVNLGEISV